MIQHLCLEQRNYVVKRNWRCYNALQCIIDSALIKHNKL